MGGGNGLGVRLRARGVHLIFFPRYLFFTTSEGTCATCSSLSRKISPQGFSYMLGARVGIVTTSLGIDVDRRVLGVRIFVISPLSECTSMSKFSRKLGCDRLSVVLLLSSAASASEHRARVKFAPSTNGGERRGRETNLETRKRK